MISWNILKRVYGFVGELPNEEKMKNILEILSEKRTYQTLVKYVRKEETLLESSISVGMILPSENQEDFFLNNLRYYDEICTENILPLERILPSPDISLMLEIYKDSVLTSYYKGEYKSRKDLVNKCAEELEKMITTSLPHMQMSLYDDKKVIRVNSNYYRVKDLTNQLQKNREFLTKETKAQLSRFITDRLIQWGQVNSSLEDLQSLLT